MQHRILKQKLEELNGSRNASEENQFRNTTSKKIPSLTDKTMMWQSTQQDSKYQTAKFDQVIRGRASSLVALSKLSSTQQNKKPSYKPAALFNPKPGMRRLHQSSETEIRKPVHQRPLPHNDHHKMIRKQTNLNVSREFVTNDPYFDEIVGMADKQGLSYNYKHVFEEFQGLQTRIGQVSSNFLQSKMKNQVAKRNAHGSHSMMTRHSKHRLLGQLV